MALSFLEFKSLFKALPPCQQAGFFVWPSLQGPQLLEEEKKVLRTFKPKGLVLFRRNLSSFGQSLKMILALKEDPSFQSSVLSLPRVLAVDEEGGRVSRLPRPFPKGFPMGHFEHYKSLEKACENLESQILHQAFVLKGLGFNCVLAPVVDVLSEVRNTVSKDRAFSSDPEKVIFFAQRVFKIFQQQGFLSCMKHFPGHGNTLQDSHKEFASSPVSLKILKSREFLPFTALSHSKIPLCMTAHVLIPSVDPHHPATLSPIFLQKYLRQDIGFKGLILSDDLHMNAIHDFYAKKNVVNILPTAACDALTAGCDVVLSCHSICEEQNILQGLADKLSDDGDFYKMCVEKAYRIFQTLNKYL